MEEYLYDFLLHRKSCIIETHGIQHYQDNSFFGSSNISIQDNDINKKNLALQNGIKNYIELDCRQSNIEWIKKSVMDSELPTLFNFTEKDINWEECEKYALKNMVKVSCDLYNDNPNYTANEISNLLHIKKSSVVNYLNRGAKLGWCDYNPNSIREHINKQWGNTIAIYKDWKYVGFASSAKSVSQKVKELFGEDIPLSAFEKALNGNYIVRNHYYIKKVQNIRNYQDYLNYINDDKNIIIDKVKDVKYINKNNAKGVFVYKDNNFINYFNSLSSTSKNIRELFNVNICIGTISKYLDSSISYKGFIFKSKEYDIKQTKYETTMLSGE